MTEAATMFVDLADGRRWQVSREPFAWLVDNVPEAVTAETRVEIYAIGARLAQALAAVGGATIETEQMRVGRLNDASAAVVRAWDALMQAMAVHPSYGNDHRDACARLGVDSAAAAMYATAVREVIDGYREQQRIPKGGRPPSLRMEFLSDAARQVRQLLSVGENRAAAIVAGMATIIGVPTDPATLRQTIRNRRVRNG